MTTYSKETALYDTGAISDGIDDASTKATNFLSVDNTGIMVYDGKNGRQSPSEASSGTRNVFIDPESLNIRNGQNTQARFGSDGIKMYDEDTEMFVLDNDGGEAKKRILIDRKVRTSMGSSFNITFNWENLSNEMIGLEVSYAPNYNKKTKTTGILGIPVTSTTSSKNFPSATGSVPYYDTVPPQSTKYGTINVNVSYTKYTTGGTFSVQYSISNVSSAYMGEVICEVYRTYTDSSAPYLCFGSRSSDVLKGGYSSTFGLELYARQPYEMVVGKYNKINSNTDLFVVGNGSSDGARSNAFSVNSTGDVTADRNVTDGYGFSIPFIGTKDVTTYDEVTAALAAGKMVFIKDFKDEITQMFRYISTSGTDAHYNFARSNVGNSTLFTEWLTLDPDNTWTKAIYKSLGGVVNTLSPDTLNINLGTYLASGHTTSSCGTLSFSIPTGRVFPFGTTLNSMTATMVARAGNANGTGAYIVKSTSGGTVGASFNSKSTFSFYNMANQSKSLAASKMSVSLHGYTNIYVNLTSGVDNYFSGNATNSGYINNNPVAVFLTSIVINVTIPA